MPTPPSRAASPDEVPTDDEESQIDVGAEPGNRKKRSRPSKKGIPEYAFTENQVLEIVEFLKQHPCLYDKRDRMWINPHHKEDLWRELASHFPECTHHQVRKYFDKKRTDFGKIEKRESRSGGPLRDRTTREEHVMTTWAFLAGHITHEQAQPSERFSPSPGTSGRASYPPAESAEDDSGQSGISLRSLIRRRRSTEERAQHPMAVSPSSQEQQTLASHAIQELLQKADKLTHKTPLTGFDSEIQRFVDFLFVKLKKVSPANFSMLSAKLLEIVSAMEEPSKDVSQLQNPSQILAGFAMPSTSAAAPQHLQQMWQQVPHPPPPPPVMPVAFQQQQYQQQQYQQPQYYQPPPPMQQQPQQQQPQQQQQQQQQPQPPAQMQITMPWSPVWPMVNSPMTVTMSPVKTPLSRAIAELPPLEETTLTKPAQSRRNSSSSIRTPRGPDEPDLEDEEP